MYEMTEADMIWNRACGEAPLRTRPGDRALADLLRAHGLVMNGGVLHAVECLTSRERSDAESGYRFYGLAPVACLLSRARAILAANEDLELHESQLDREYDGIVPDDTALVERFEEHLKANPSDYAPLRARDME